MERLSRNWWTIAARGALAIVLGLLLVANVGDAGPAAMLGFFLVGMACVEILGSLGEPTDDTQGFAMLADGIGVLVIGGLAMLSARAQAHVALLAAAWACLTGVSSLVSALDVRAHLPRERIMLATSVVSGVAAGAMALWRAAEPNEIRGLAGVYAILLGVLLILFASRVRGGGEIHFIGSHPA